MPEGPELHLASRYINTVCAGLLFSGKVEKSAVSKNPEVPFESRTYVISATPRGKEVKLTLLPVKEEESLCLAEESSTAGQDPDSPPQPMDVVFRFGMSGSFKLVPETELPKHAHLRFYTRESPRRILCFVDFRRFGRWEVQGTWQPDRGPCVMLEYEKFRESLDQWPQKEKGPARNTLGGKPTWMLQVQRRQSHHPRGVPKTAAAMRSLRELRNMAGRRSSSRELRTAQQMDQGSDMPGRGGKAQPAKILLKPRLLLRGRRGAGGGQLLTKAQKWLLLAPDRGRQGLMGLSPLLFPSPACSNRRGDLLACCRQTP